MKIRTFTFEEELERIKPTIRRLVNLFLFGKRIVVKGENNFIKTGPNIIVGNHIGSFKDIAVLFRVVPRPIFFTANEAIFDKVSFEFLIRKHLKRHLKEFGLFLNKVLTPIKAPFVRFITTNIDKVGTIPADSSSGYRGMKLVFKKWEEHLKQGRAVVILQGWGRMKEKDPHPYIASFKGGFSILASHLFKQKVLVPVTLVVIFGTHIPWLVPGKIRINIGKPMYCNGDVEEFRSALEKRARMLLIELLKK